MGPVHFHRKESDTASTCGSYPAFKRWAQEVDYRVLPSCTLGKEGNTVGRGKDLGVVNQAINGPLPGWLTRLGTWAPWEEPAHQGSFKALCLWK